MPAWREAAEWKLRVETRLPHGHMCDQWSWESHPGPSEPQAWSDALRWPFPARASALLAARARAAASREMGCGLVAVSSGCPDQGMGVAEHLDLVGARRLPGLQTWPATPALPRCLLHPSSQEAASSRSLFVNFWRVVGEGNIWQRSKEHNKKKRQGERRRQGWGRFGKTI